MVDPTPEHRFNVLAYSTIRDDISIFETEINLPVGGANAFNKAFQSGAYVYATLTDVLGSIEIIRITDIEGDKLTVERGQDVTIAQVWLAGSIITQRFVAANALQTVQETGFRTIAFNPNGGMTADYPGEKVRELGLDACNNRWWKSTEGTKWRLIVGTICPREFRDGEGYIQPAQILIFLIGGQITGAGRILDTDNYESLSNTWLSVTDMPLPARDQHAGTSLSFKLYSFCGREGTGLGDVLSDTDEYDPDLDSWSAKADIPAPPRLAPGATAINDVGYVFNGRDNTATRIRDTDEYDPDAWTSKTDTPTPARQWDAAITIGTKAYIFGGLSVGGINDNDEYDPDAWTSKTDLPFPGRYGASACTVNGKGYCFGGRNGARLDDNDEYDPVDVWTSKTDVPAPARYLGAAETADEKGHYLGGFDGSSNFITDNDEYDPTGDSWVAVAAILSPGRANLASGAI